jgi:hypothetical protein
MAIMVACRLIISMNMELLTERLQRLYDGNLTDFVMGMGNQDVVMASVAVFFVPIVRWIMLVSVCVLTFISDERFDRLCITYKNKYNDDKENDDNGNNSL